MPTTPFEDLYTAVQAMMVDVATASSPETITLASDNYGTRIEVTAGNSMYQVRISPSEDDGANSNVNYPRAEVVILIHHHKTIASDEIAFLHKTMSHVADAFLDRATWRAESGIYDLDDEEPEISEASREGRVITFEITATVLMDAV
jgi:hypothetical protein